MNVERSDSNANGETLGVRYTKVLRLRRRISFPNEFERIRRRIEVLEHRLSMLRSGRRLAARKPIIL